MEPDEPDWWQLQWEQEYQQWLESLDADEEYQRTVGEGLRTIQENNDGYDAVRRK